MSARLYAAIVSLLFVLAAAPARAAEPAEAKHKVLLLPLEAEGLLPADRDALEHRLRPAFEHPEIELLSPALPELESCSDEPCLRSLAREHGASHVVRAQVLADGRDYIAQLEVMNLDRELPASTIDASCQICGLAEFDDRLAARAVAARELILATPRVGRLLIVGRPTDARVRVDGQLRGRLPFSEELPVGQHELIVIADGHFRQVVPVETLAGVEQRLEVALAPKPIPQWQRSVGWTTLGIGIGSLATGTVLIGVHGQPATLRCESDGSEVVDADGDCRWLRRTLGAGVGLTVMGIVAATTGATLLTIDATRRRAHARADTRDVEVRALLGLNRVGLWIRF
jgi:hypothetical protein